jgi:hypothetical protein
MQKNLIASLLIFLSFNFVQAQTVIWKNNFGGSSLEDGFQVIKATTAGYYVLGVVNSSDYDGQGNHGQSDMLLIRTDENGNKIWSKCIGGTGEDLPYKLIICRDGNLLLVGITASIDGDFVGGSWNVEGVVVRMDTSGNILQTKFTNGNSIDGLYDVIEEANGNFVAVGETYSTNIPNHHDLFDFYLVKYDSNLNVIYQTCFGDYGDEGATRILPYKNGYLLGGETNSNGGQVTGLHGGFRDMWIVKVDSAGTFLNGICLGGTEVESFKDFIEDTTGGILLTGGTYSNNGNVNGNHMDQTQVYNSDIWICKLDSNLQFINQRCIGGLDYDRGMKIIYRNGEYVLLVQALSYDFDIPCTQSGVNGAIVTLQPGGFVINYCFGDAGDDAGNDFISINDSSLVIVGYSSSAAGTYINGNYGDFDIFLDRIDDGIINEISYQPNNNISAFVYNNEIYCNSLNGKKISLVVTDITGRVIFNNTVNINQGILDIDLSEFCVLNCLYVLSLSTHESSTRLKFISGM